MFHTKNPIIKHKAGLLNLAQELGNVSKACKVMGVSRDTFYRYQELVEDGGINNLINKSRRGANLKNRVDDAAEQAVVAYAVEQPAHGQHRTSNELRKSGVFISGSGVRSVWIRHNLENFKKRLKALEEKVARASEGRGRGLESRLAHHLTVSSENAALPLRYFFLLKSTSTACKYWASAFMTFYPLRYRPLGIYGHRFLRFALQLQRYFVCCSLFFSNATLNLIVQDDFGTLPPRQRCQRHLAKAPGNYESRNHLNKNTETKKSRILTEREGECRSHETMQFPCLFNTTTSRPAKALTPRLTGDNAKH